MRFLRLAWPLRSSCGAEATFIRRSEPIAASAAMPSLRWTWLVVTGVRSPILDGFFPCGACGEFTVSCKHYGRRQGRPPKEPAPDADPSETVRAQAIRLVGRRCEGCARKSTRFRVRPVTHDRLAPSQRLHIDDLLVLCPRCYSFVAGFPIAQIAHEPWAPPMLAALVQERERAGLPL